MTNITVRQFRNIICILKCIDGWELPEAWSDRQAKAFIDNPVDAFLHADDERMSQIWEIVKAHLKPKPAIVEINDETPF